MFTRTVLCYVFLLYWTSAGHANDSKKTAISQFWTDDYKVFDQIYGKTSDREIYGATLPPSITYGLELKKPFQLEASEKRERYSTNGKNILEFDTQPYDIGDRYAKLFAKSLYSEKSKPSSALQFISFSDVKPISQSTDPEMYNYLKHLEHGGEEKYGISKTVKSKYVPYGDVDSDVEADEAYRSIQDILHAHEANKANSSNEDDEDTNLRPKGKQRATESENEGQRYSRSRKRNKVRLLNGNSIKSKCVSGRCRSPGPLRVHSVPFIRKIKHYRYTKR